MLLIVMLMATLVIIGLATELPSITGQLRRDREEEMIHRGVQYARAIRRFYKKTNSYPMSIDQLLNTNHVRYLRKKYKDPMTGEDFRLLHQNDVEITGSVASTNSLQGNTTQSGNATSLFGNTATATSTNIFSNQNTQSASNSTSNSSSDSSANSSAKDGSTDSSQSSSTSDSQKDSKGNTFGGGPIIGVASKSPKKGFHIFNKKETIKDWAFIYVSTMDTGALITGPYNGIQSSTKLAGATSVNQMQSGNSQSTTTNSSPFSNSASPTSNSFSNSFSNSPTSGTQ
jgi:hypothetical protein